MYVPSERARRRLDLYREIHKDPKTFVGGSVMRHADHIRTSVMQYGVSTLLDYGSGKGIAYGTPALWSSFGTPMTLEQYLGAKVTCFDPCYEKFSARPEGKFGGVICANVLEFVPEEDVDAVLDDLFSYAETFLYVYIDVTAPSPKKLSNGEDLYCTTRDQDFWDLKMDAAHARRGVPIDTPVWYDAITAPA
jgi:hypothetical protein